MNKSFGLFVVLSVALVAVTYGQLSEKLNPLVESKPGFTKCKAEACGTYTSDCSSNPDCDCFKTIDKYGVCILGTTPCPPKDGCDDCSSDAGVCIVDSCCGPKTCLPITGSTNCTSPPSPHSFRMAKMMKPKKCKDHSECEGGKLCKSHVSGMFCA
ncbi:hypothetical protein M3Y98_00776700 [Aphelenchoides besseyi]|nr:hypothetical protein M3Y98_00776700 [Aphelenchoides besseyi]KAI6211795.1 hypothetical protein M3Y96_00472300 [Aphelenchoides besseyi]